MPKTLLYALILILACLLYTPIHYTWNRSPSLPTGIYEITDEPLYRGSFVLMREPLKQLVGIPGDNIRVAAEGTYVNGHLIPNSAVPPSSPYPHYPYTTFALVEGQYWLLGNNPLSWDSRYVGPFPAALVASSVKPVWVKK